MNKNACDKGVSWKEVKAKNGKRDSPLIGELNSAETQLSRVFVQFNIGGIREN